MDQEKNTQPVAAPVPTEQQQHTDVVKRADSSSSQQGYMFDEMANVEKAEYDPDDIRNDIDERSQKRSTFRQKYRNFIK